MLQKVLIAIGGLLVASAVAVFLCFTWLVYQIIYEPEQVTVLKFLEQHLPVNTEAISGVILDNQFVIQVHEPFRLLFCFIGIVLCLSVLISIFRVILQAGIEIIKLGTVHTETVPSNIEYDNNRWS